MQVVNKPNKTTAKDLQTKKYEFRACGGSVEPDDYKEPTEEKRREGTN